MQSQVGTMKEIAASEQALVLIVDDFSDSREMYAELLRGEGFRVAEAVNGRQGVDLALALAPSLILMDLSLPVLDGLTAIRLLKDDLRSADIPVIALTAHALEEDISAATLAGCAAFLLKPCAPDALLETIQRLLPRSASSFS